MAAHNLLMVPGEAVPTDVQGAHFKPRRITIDLIQDLKEWDRIFMTPTGLPFSKGGGGGGGGTKSTFYQ